MVRHTVSRRYSVYPSDHTETDDGIDLPPTQEMQESTPEGEQYMLREYENPLPEAVRNRESLRIQIRLYQSVDSLYFDGTDCYELPDERQEAGAMTATVSRADAQTRHFYGVKALTTGSKYASRRTRPPSMPMSP